MSQYHCGTQVDLVEQYVKDSSRGTQNLSFGAWYDLMGGLP